MHILSTMSGDMPVKNWGTVLLGFSLFQITFPLLASRQVRIAEAPNVTTFPLATAGVLLGPGCCEADGPETAMAAYVFFHSSFPVAASRHSTTSSLPCRVFRYILFPVSTGVASPKPTLTFQSCLSSVGHVEGALKPVTLLSRPMPLNCGQSCEKESVELRIISVTITLII